MISKWTPLRPVSWRLRDVLFTAGIIVLLAGGNSALAATWHFESTATGSSPIGAQSGSPALLDGSFDFTFNSSAGAYSVTALSVSVANSPAGLITFNSPALAFVTTTGTSRGFSFVAGAGLQEYTLAFTVNESSVDNSLSDSNLTGTVDVADRPGGFLGGQSVPPHDVVLLITDYSGGFSNPVSNYTTFGGVQLVNNDVPQVPLPAAAWLFMSALTGLGAVKRLRQNPAA